MIDLHIEDKCFACPCPELQTEKLVYKTCTGRADVHIHIYCQNEEKCEESTGGKRKMEVAAVSGMVGFCLGYLVCVFLITGRDDDGE